MGIKINRLDIENVKRIKAVKIEPTESGLTVVGGRNNQGKTSVLDAIAWALGGEKFRPSNVLREGAAGDPFLRIELSNGIIVERRGKNSDLKVIDPSGNRAGQQLLNEFVDQLALDLPKFIGMSSKEKANTLLQIIGVGEQLGELERQEKQLYSRRYEIGRIADQKKKYAAEMVTYPDAPADIISPSELLRRQQDILIKNGENRKKREKLEDLKTAKEMTESQILALQQRLDQINSDLEIAQKSAENLIDESTAELEDNIANIEKINIKVRANLDKEKAAEDAAAYDDEYSKLTAEIDSVRSQKTALLNNAEMPLDGLSVEEGELIYNGFKWDGMSGSDQLKVATAIVRKLNPKCGFVLLDKLEQMDDITLNEFGDWLISEGLQAIATRVSTGDECSVIIEDGYSNSTTPLPIEKKWKEGQF